MKKEEYGREIFMKKIYRICAAGVICSLIFTGAYQYRCHRLQEDLAKRVLRFHVIANSDTKADQNLKLKVRDEIGTYLGKELSGTGSLEECEREVADRLDEIEDCARTVVAREGYDYPVKASVKDTDFPKKTYGDYTFPKGRYHALKVTIGSGKGKNWWCVMYPNLCFSGSMYEVIDENAKEELREALSDEDYEEIMAEGKIRVKFKYLEKFLELFR